MLDHLYASSLAAAVTGSPTDGKRAIEILTGLAQVYPDLPLHGANVGQGRLTAQSLEEAVAATTLARSYALVCDRMTASQRAEVTDRLFRPMVQVISDHLMNRTHNIEVWHLAGLASLAVVLDDHDLAERTLHREHGFHDQLTDGLRPDGWWFEGSPGYHFYMLTAVLNAVESYQALGLDSAATGALERMLLTPVETARDDLTVPPFNDSALGPAVPPGLANHADLYFRGARLCRSEPLDRFLGSALTAGFDRSTLDHLVYGRPDDSTPVADDEWPTERRSVLPDSGYAILRRPPAGTDAGGDTSVFLKFGPHGGGHGHPDKLGIELMINGSRVIADPGTAMYTNPIHQSWYVQTWSHSTVLIDRISQPPITGRLVGHRPVTTDRFGCVDAEVVFDRAPADEGEQILWHDEDPAPVAAYAGVRIRRILAMVPPEQGDYLLDLVLVSTPHDRTIELITHVRGTLTDPPSRSARSRLLLPQFDDVRRAEDATGHTDYLLTDDDRPWSRWHTGAEELLTARTPSNPPHLSCASTIERVVGRRAVFAAALPLGSAGLTGLSMTSSGEVEVVSAGHRHLWRPPPEQPSTAPSRPWSEEPPIQLES